MRGYATLLIASLGMCAVFALGGNNPPGGPAQNDLDEAELDSEPVLRSIDRRLEEKSRVYALVLAGDMPLVDAVRAVFAMNKDWPAIPPAAYDYMPGLSPGERVADTIICSARSTLADDRREAVLERLECEYAALAGETGPEWTRDRR